MLLFTMFFAHVHSRKFLMLFTMFFALESNFCCYLYLQCFSFFIFIKAAEQGALPPPGAFPEVGHWKAADNPPHSFFAAIYKVVCSSSQFVLLFWCHLQCVSLFFSISGALHNGFHSSAQFLLLSKMCFTLHVHFGCYLQYLSLFFLLLLSVYSQRGFSK